MANDLRIKPPEGLEGHIYINEEGEVFVDRNHEHSPTFISWIEKIKRKVSYERAGSSEENGHLSLDSIYKVVDAAELVRLIEGAEGQAVDDVTDDFRRRARDLILLATQYGTSDMHFQVRESDTTVTFDVGGRTRIANYLTREEGSRILRAIYQGLSPTSDKSYMPSEHQNAQIPGKSFPSVSNLTSVRGIKGPCYPQDVGGQYMTLRLQYKGGRPRPSRRDVLPYPPKPEGEYQLPNMGYTPKQINKLDHLMKVPSGIILVMGPTGSGKTTTNFELLNELMRRKPYKRLVTVEDPVEIPMPFAVQLSVSNATDAKTRGLEYQKAVTTMLRMAPKVILIGELRDEQVASMALEAARTGHTVLTTLHVDDAFEWVGRLEGMGDGRLKRTDFCHAKVVRGVIAQRLVSRLCPHCSVPVKGNAEVIRELGSILEALLTWGDVRNVRTQGNGCEKCNHSGGMGRAAVAEVVVATRALMHDFIKYGDEIAEQNYRKTPESDPTLLESAIRLVLKGEVDPQYVEDEIDVIPKRERPLDRHEAHLVQDARGGVAKHA